MEKKLYEKMGIENRRRKALMAGVGCYLLGALVLFVYEKGNPGFKVFVAGMVIQQIVLNYVANTGNTGTSIEFAELLKYYPVDGNVIYRIIKRKMVLYSIAFWCVSLVLAAVMQKGAEPFIFGSVLNFFVMESTILGYWIGYGRYMKEEKGKEASLESSLGVCLLFTYPFFGIIIAAVYTIAYVGA